jgi:hypothetical protein
MELQTAIQEELQRHNSTMMILKEKISSFRDKNRYQLIYTIIKDDCKIIKHFLNKKDADEFYVIGDYRRETCLENLSIDSIIEMLAQ